MRITRSASKKSRPASKRRFGSLALLAMALPLLGYQLPAWAQGKGYTSVEEALKDVKRAGVCSRDDVAASTSGMPMLGVDAAPDLGCALAPADAMALQGRPDTVVVDTRPAREFALFHIDSSLNATPSELRVKPFLQSKSLILAGSGKGERELYVACGELRRAGFKQVKVLRGGLPAWLAHQQPVVGRIEAAESMVRLTPGQLWAEARFDANLVLLAPGMASLQKEFPKGVLLRDDSPEALKTIVEKRRREARNVPLASIVLVAGSTAQDDRIGRLIQALKPVPVLVYGDTAEALKQFLVSQEAAWKVQARGPKQPKCGL